MSNELFSSFVRPTKVTLLTFMCCKIKQKCILLYQMANLYAYINPIAKILFTMVHIKTLMSHHSISLRSDTYIATLLIDLCDEIPKCIVRRLVLFGNYMDLLTSLPYTPRTYIDQTLIE